MTVLSSISALSAGKAGGRLVSMLLLKRRLNPAGCRLSLAVAPEMINAAGLLAGLLEAPAGLGTFLLASTWLGLPV